MRISHSLQLDEIFDSSSICILLTTGRAGTDFLQSLYDSHEEVASTCEKSIHLDSFIKKYAPLLLPYSPQVFAALATELLLESFAPYIDTIEGWNLSPTSHYFRADVNLFIANLTHLLSRTGIPKEPLKIAKAIILSFYMSLNRSPSRPKIVLLHLHHINTLPYYQPYLEEKDKIIVCSRNLYSLVHSGVNNHSEFWLAEGNYASACNLAHYKYVLNRSFNDHLLLNGITKGTYLPITRQIILDKLSSIEYLNKLNSFLEISPFAEYPPSTVFGLTRNPDKVSAVKPVNKHPGITTSFNTSIVSRGNEISLLGLVECSLISCAHARRIIFYKIHPKSSIQNRICNLPPLARATLASFLIIFPTKTELRYLSRSIYSFGRLICSRKLSIYPLLSFLKVQTYNPIVYILLRIQRIASFRYSSDSSIFIREP